MGKFVDELFKNRILVDTAGLKPTNDGMRVRWPRARSSPPTARSPRRGGGGRPRDRGRHGVTASAVSASCFRRRFSVMLRSLSHPARLALPGLLTTGVACTSAGLIANITPTTVADICGVAASGAGYCWGYNGGAVGDGTMDHRSRPTPVVGGLTFQSVGVGTAQTCGVTTASEAYCWGSNSNGELGDGTTASHAVPAPVRWQ